MWVQTIPLVQKSILGEVLSLAESPLLQVQIVSWLLIIKEKREWVRMG